MFIQVAWLEWAVSFIAAFTDFTVIDFEQPNSGLFFSIEQKYKAKQKMCLYVKNMQV